MQIKVIEGTKSSLGEGPLWDEERNVLYLLDVLEMRLMEYNPKTEKVKSYKLPKFSNSVVKYSENELLVLSENELNVFNLDDETFTHLHTVDHIKEGTILNDAYCDEKGRLWTGSVDVDYRTFKQTHAPTDMSYKRKISSMYLIDEQLNVIEKKDQVVISNGLEIDPKRNKLYYVDSATQAIVQFDINIETGEISNEEIVYEFDPLDGFPDGMTIDEEGRIYAALFKTEQVIEFNPGHGVVAIIDPIKKEWIDSIQVPTSHVTSCAFGGEDNKTLYITTAFDPLTEKMHQEQPNAGKLFSIRLDVAGNKINRFNHQLTFNK